MNKVKFPSFSKHCFIHFFFFPEVVNINSLMPSGPSFLCIHKYVFVSVYVCLDICDPYVGLFYFAQNLLFVLFYNLDVFFYCFFT